MAHVSFDAIELRRLDLTRMHKLCILVCMRTTLNIDADLLADAGRLSGIKEKTTLVRAGLGALIARESAKRLAGRYRKTAA